MLSPILGNDSLIINVIYLYARARGRREDRRRPLQGGGKNALPPVNRGGTGAAALIYTVRRGGARGKRTLIERLLVSGIATPDTEVYVLLIMLRRAVEDVSQQASPDVAGI